MFKLKKWENRPKILGWVSGDIIGEIIVTEENFTRYKYLDILQNIIIPKLRAIFPEPEMINLVI